MTNSMTTELNQLILSGQVTSPVKIYSSGKLVFTLGNSSGRFFVQWTTPRWIPSQGDRIIVHGLVFSVLNPKRQIRHAIRIRATNIILMNREDTLVSAMRNGG